MIRTVSAATLAAALCALPTTSQAQQACDLPVLDQIERDAQRANREGRHDEARARFEDGWTRCHLPRTLARLGLTEAALGRWLDADAHVREALRTPDDAWIRANAPALHRELARIADHLGTLLVTGRGARGEVRINGQTVAPWPMESEVRALVGTATVEVTAAGYVSATRVLRIEPGVLTREEVALVPRAPAEPDATAQSRTAPNGTATLVVTVQPPAPAPAPAPVPLVLTPRLTTATSTPWQRPAGWVALTLATTALGVGIGATVLHDGATRAYHDAGCEQGGTDASCRARYDDVYALRPWMYAGFAAAGVLGITTAILWATAPASAPGDRAFRCAPTGAGVTCGARF